MPNRRSLKLLLTTRAFDGGGAERVWTTLAGLFAARGDQVTLAVDEGGGDPVFADAANPRVVVLGAGHLRATMRLSELLRETRPDVALAAISGSCVKLVGAATIARTGTPLVVSYHGFQEYRTGNLAAVAYYGMRMMNLMAERIVTVSDGLRLVLIDRWGADAAKTTRIYNPMTLDLADAAASADDLATRGNVVLAVGRLSAEKGMGDLVAAFAQMTRRDARLVIAGDGPERGRLERQAQELGLAERVRFLGQVADPTALYRTARVLAVPSRTEAFGMVVVEALAHGLPIVATDCSGPSEILEGGKYGRMVPIGDTAAMAAALDAALLDGQSPQARIARAGAFSMAAGFADWARLIDEIVTARTGRDPRGQAAT